MRKREEVLTARIQAEYSPESHSMLIVSRAVAQFRLHAPPQWLPMQASWNGQVDLTIEKPGCWVFQASGAVPCP